MGFGVDDENNFIVSAFLAFFSTTIDDFIVLLFFIALAEMKEGFARTQAHLEILTGLTAAYTLILSMSLLALILTALASEEWVSLIGIVPVIVGIMKAFVLFDRDCMEKDQGKADKDEGNDEKPIDDRPGEGTSLLEHGVEGAGAGDGGIEQQSRRSGDEQSSHDQSISASRANYASKEQLSEMLNDIPSPDDISDSWLNQVLGPFFNNCMSPLALDVFLSTVACGSDNIAIYAAVFAASNPLEVGLIIAVIFGLIYLCYIAAGLVLKLEGMRYFCVNYTEYLIPPLLVLLGIYVLTDSVLWELIN